MSNYSGDLRRRVVTSSGGVLKRVFTTARRFRIFHARGLHHAALSAIAFTVTAAMISIFTLLMGLHYLYFDRSNLPDIEPLMSFEFPVAGHVYDVNGRPLIELATEHRQIVQCRHPSHCSRCHPCRRG
jgi:hypothetical protein